MVQTVSKLCDVTLVNSFFTDGLKLAACEIEFSDEGSALKTLMMNEQTGPARKKWQSEHDGLLGLPLTEVH